MKFEHAAKLALLVIVMLHLLGCGPSEAEIKQKALEQEQLEQERLESLAAENKRLELIDKFHVKANALIEGKNFNRAIYILDSALSIAVPGEEPALNQLKAKFVFHNEEFDESLSIYSLLIENQFNLIETYYGRALCYEKLHRKQEAVNDLRAAIALGSVEANDLHKRINPLKRKIAYYVTRCCDGSTSNAKGRGACSHHGGVCNWNDLYTMNIENTDFNEQILIDFH